MMDKKVNAMQTTDQQRRQFLRAVGLGGVGVVAALAGAVSKMPAENPAAVAEAEPAAVNGYQASEHVQKYYRTTKV
jgi:hypothetical protein